MKGRRVIRGAVAIACALLAVAPVSIAADGDDPAGVLAGIRSTRLAPERAVTLRNVTLDLGVGRLDFRRGTLIPAVTAGGRTIEVVFLGSAQFRLKPQDPVEAGQLELFTGRPALDVHVDEAVLVLADETVLRRLLYRPPAAVSGGLLDRARELHGTWLVRPERRTTGVESSIFRFVVGDAVYRDYFALWGRSYEVGEFVYQLDPEEEEPLTLASFVPVDVHGWERMRLARHIRIQQRKGRWLGVRVEDLGAWDVWLSERWTPGGNAVYPGRSGFEPEHYELDVTLKRGRLELDGRARIRVVAQTAGRHTLTLELYRDLTPTRIVDDRGDPLFFFRSGTEVIVHLPRAPDAGQRLTLDIAYGGRVLKWAGPGVFDLEDTHAWYPHVGTVDRATYDVTLRWPRRYQLISSGKRIAGGRRERYLWERRRLDRATGTVSFVLGKFLVEHRRFGDVDVRLAFNRETPYRLTPEVRAQAVDTLGRALRYFEQRFGPYPLDELTAVTLRRDYSQSYLGFITLTDRILLGEQPFDRMDRDLVRETLIAHEVAHQWWGNWIGWWSYRDQWLSEAMANFASVQFYADQLGEGSSFLADMSSGWREMLSQRTPEGRTIESLGPLVLGSRLNSSLSSSAYRAIVYRKGAAVLAMLARTVGEQPFNEMLRNIVDAAADKVLTTETFLRSLERMSGLDLDGFARRYVYGTGIPDVYYDYESQLQEDGSWQIRGSVVLASEPHYQFRIVRRGERWDVLRSPRDQHDDRPSALMVPFRVEQADENGGRRGRSGRVVRSLWGRLLIEGAHQDFEVPSNDEPLELELDPRGEILARFYDAQRYPKRRLRFLAHNLALAGEVAAAENGYRKALEARRPPGGEVMLLRDPQRDARVEDARIRLGLARLYLDQQRVDEAAAELDETDGLLHDQKEIFRMERDVLASHVDLARGDTADVLRRLRRTLRRAAPERGARTWRDLLWQIQLNSERAAVTEGYALLAIAAAAEADEDVLVWALDEAVERGVEIGQFGAGVLLADPPDRLR